MISRWAEFLVAAALVAAPGALAAQGVREFGLQATAAIARESFVGGGLAVAWRPSSRSRLALTASPGAASGTFALRGEASLQFLLDPFTARRLGIYAGTGLAAEAGRRADGYLLLLLGIESRPGAPSGWAMDVGVGGGVRISVGWRWRRLPPGWRAREDR